MRIAKKLTILAFLSVGAGTLLASCGDNAQTCGPGTEPDENGVCTPTGDGPDADPGPDGDEPDAEMPDADTAFTVGGTIAIFDTTLTDPSIALAGLGAVRGGAVRISFNDLTDPNRGGIELYREAAGAPIGSCLVTKYDATHPPYDRLDAGAITVAGGAFLKNNASMSCTMQATQGDPDPYLCTSHSQASSIAGALVVGGGAVAYSFVSPAVSFGMSTPVTLATAVRPANNTGVFVTSTPHGLKNGQFVAIAGFTPASFNTPVSANYPTGTSGIQVLSPTQFAMAQPGTTAGEAVTTAGTFSATSNQFTGSNIMINGFTAGPNAPLFNSGTSRLMVLTQLNDNTLLLLNTATSLLAPGTQTQGLTVSYDIARQNPSVTTTNFVELHDFLTGAAGTTVSDLHITKAAQAGVWGAIDVTADVPGEAPAPAAITSMIRSNQVVTVTLPTGHGVTTGQRMTIAGSAPVNAGRPAFNGTFTVTGTTATTYTFAQAVGFLTVTGVGPAIVATGSTSVLTNAAALATGLTGATVTVAGATTAANNGTFPITASTANTIDYTNAAGVTEVFAAGTSYTINEPALTPGTAQKPSFALDTGGATASQQPHSFPTTTAANTAPLNYSCDNDTMADVTDDTCGDEANSTATATLKALIVSGSATKKSVAGLFPFQMPTEVVGNDEWLEWTCAYILNKSANMPIAAVQAIIDFAPTRIEQQVLFVSGTLLSDGVNESQLRVLTGHALAGHQTFCPNAGPAGCPACSDGIDNDGAGGIDFPADTGCTDANDTTE